VATVETTAPVPAERERLLALGAGLVTVTLWASAFVGIRSASHHLSPGALALGRLSIASLALGLIAIFLGWLLLDESPPALALAGGAVCLVGVFIAQRRPAGARRPG
jgi:drug/metabolite transporter (DMT)-like permease